MRQDIRKTCSFQQESPLQLPHEDEDSDEVAEERLVAHDELVEDDQEEDFDEVDEERLVVHEQQEV